MSHSRSAVLSVLFALACGLTLSCAVEGDGDWPFTTIGSEDDGIGSSDSGSSGSSSETFADTFDTSSDSS
ncbi:MAG: hypothetical protein KC457_35240, partial [Myxococcales bacterium]|nr:hypothetical protein [Myxococcales bacterium]